MELVTRTTRTARGRRPEATPHKTDLLEVYEKGRHCQAAKDCGGKELSIYNRGPNCHACDLSTGSPEQRIAELWRRDYTPKQIAEITEADEDFVREVVSALEQVAA